ncbi:CPXCG motif-containing cysteine-rich protein [Echinicola sp. 20G]|uniref:CPXCG motif-containing cysteine-rich protein n=1 Tax=Echinicola sp. 20G TaxID=2781961 RepID=UPI0019109564|nr:CPXCG motif-containing cysteine-rich protein [Echinicola sp. 20G]
MLTQEYHFTCPYCFSPISMILDLSVSPQKYIEDCEVCCQPIEVDFEAREGEITNITTRPIDQ